MTRWLFNFAASFSGGGYKRLHEYAKWFQQHGGANFVIHPNCVNLVEEFPANRFFVVRQTALQRLFNDGQYLESIEREIGRPDLYYSYGIPMYRRFGNVNWFHLSNVLPLALSGIPLDLRTKLKLGYLGHRIRKTLANADVASAESRYSLSVMKAEERKLFLSVNGSDDELEQLHTHDLPAKAEVATAVGTYTYKAIGDAVKVFDALKKDRPTLRLSVIGDDKPLPLEICERCDIEITGLLKRPQVIESLRRSKYYISTTLIENSYNAASEGIFLADESYISDIGPHRELLEGMPYREVTVPGVHRPMLHVKRHEVRGDNLKSWSDVVCGMIARFESESTGRQFNPQSTIGPKSASC